MNIKHGAFDPLNDGLVHVAMGFSGGGGGQENLHFCDFPGVGWGWGYTGTDPSLPCKISCGD